MLRQIVFGIMAVIIFSCSSNKFDDFKYHQDFSPASTEIMSQDDRLEFQDVREENRLSSWKKANWALKEGTAVVVGSRTAEWKRREDSVRDVYEGNESFVTLRGYRVPWLTLSMGEKNWKDYTVGTTITLQPGTSAGIAFRYQNSRQYYSFMLMDNNKAGLYVRLHNREGTPDHEAWTLLKQVTHDLYAKTPYRIKVTAQGDQITCFIGNEIVISVQDNTLNQGKVALLADNPAQFGPVSVNGSRLNTKLPPLPECASPVLVHQVDLPKTEGDRDFFLFDVDNDNQNEIIVTEVQNANSALRCLEFDGSQLWVISGITMPLTEGGDKPIQVFDINGDGQNELVMASDFKIRVYNGKTGRLLQTASTPKPNPYYDSRNYRYEKLLGDALCPVKIKANEPHGFYIKDRYTNIWLYDHNLMQVWHKALGTGHFPLPADIDNDGDDEILICHTLVEADGRKRWELPLSDHVDNMAFESLDPAASPKHFYLAAGEMGLIEVEPESGTILNRHELGHIQTICIGNFLPEKPGLELISQTLWREDQIHYLFDKDLNLLSHWQCSFGRVYALPWGKDGRELALTPEGVLEPLSGRQIHSSFGAVITVMDDARWGNGLVLVQDSDKILLYAPQDGWTAPAKERHYRDIQSNYFPEVAL